MKRIFRILLFIVGLVLLFIFVTPIVEDEFNSGNVIGIIIALIFIASSVLFDYIKIWISHMRQKRITRFLLALGSIAVFAVVLCFAAALGSVIACSDTQTDDEETIIVLGCKIDGDKPSTMMRERVNSACQYLRNNENAVAVLSGGKCSGENISEAECMYELMIQMGIDSSRLYLEENSTDTEENIKYSLELIEENGLSDNIAIATSEFHLKRAVMIAEKYGIENPGRISAQSDQFSTPSYYVRDSVAVIKEFVVG